MDKIDIVKRYISKCAEEHSLDSATKLIKNIISVFSSEIDGIASNLDVWDNVSYGVGSTENYSEDLDLLKQKLELYKSNLIENAMKNDPLWEFKQMFEQDLQNLLSAKSDPNNDETPEVEKQQLYKGITAKYHTIIPNLGSGLYQYYAELGFYEDVYGDSLIHNIDQLYYKLITFKTIGFPGILKETTTPLNQITISNDSKAIATAVATTSISDTMEAISQLSSNVLSETDKDELRENMQALEDIKNTGSKSKFWDKAKSVLAFLADKGADATIAAAPYIISSLKGLS